MPFFSSCIRAITSSICARQERKRKRRIRRKTPWVLFSWTRLSQPGSLENRWKEVNRDRRVPVRFSLVSEAVSHESTVLPDSNFKTCKQWIIMSQSVINHLWPQREGGIKDLLVTTGTLADKRNTLTHTHTQLRQKWEQSQGSGSATHGNHVSKNTRKGAEQSTADMSVAPEISNHSISVEHFTTNSLQMVGFPHLDSSSHYKQVVSSTFLGWTKASRYLPEQILGNLH